MTLHSLVDDALALTAALDARQGFAENFKKRQRWRDDGTAEHLGIRAAPAAADPPLPALRDGWGKVETLTETLRAPFRAASRRARGSASSASRARTGGRPRSSRCRRPPWWRAR